MKKIIRNLVVNKLKPEEWYAENNLTELNRLYDLKIKEELLEIKQSKHEDIMEFVDLIQVAFSFAKTNGFTQEELLKAMEDKANRQGIHENIVLTNLNPENPSNKIYFNI